MSRALSYLFARHVLRRETLVARADGFGLRLRFRTEDVVGRHLYKRGVHQPELTAFLAGVARESRPGDVLFDVGAHIGWFSLLLDRAIPEGAHVYAFEPDPATHRLLRENIEMNDASKVVPVECAIADRAGARELHRYAAKNTGRHSLLPLHDGAGRVQVRSVSLDELRRSEGLEHRRPRLVKIDVEGFESFVIAGARETLAACPLVVHEHCPGILERAGVDPRPSFEIMDELGFRPFRLGPGGLAPTTVDALVGAADSLEVVWTRGAEPS